MGTRGYLRGSLSAEVTAVLSSREDPLSDRVLQRAAFAFDPIGVNTRTWFVGYVRRQLRPPSGGTPFVVQVGLGCSPLLRINLCRCPWLSTYSGHCERSFCSRIGFPWRLALRSLRIHAASARLFSFAGGGPSKPSTKPIARLLAHSLGYFPPGVAALLAAGSLQQAG